MKKSLRYIFAFVLIMGMILLAISTISKYNLKPDEIYVISSENLINDGSFENFNESIYDCCNANPDNSKVSVSKSTDNIDGLYSLELTSSNQCACINKKVIEIIANKKYLLSFYYKGNKPRFCNYVTGDNKCIPTKTFDNYDDWQFYSSIIQFTDKSQSASIFFYADSDGTKTVTNLYDGLEVRRLVQMDTDYPYEDDEQYVIKTNTANVVHNRFIKLTDDGYYLVNGAPDITLKFPWTELIILIVLILIVIRLLFKKEISRTIKIYEREYSVKG